MRLARGPIVGFIDLDLEHLPDALLPMIRRIEAGADVVVGRRVIMNPMAKPLRVLLSWGYRVLIHQLLYLPVRDSEAGIKVFRRQAILKILDETLDKHWFWDTEVIHRAFLRGLRIEEHPVVFVEKPEKKSTVRLIPDTLAYLKAILAYKRRLAKEAEKEALSAPHWVYK